MAERVALDEAVIPASLGGPDADDVREMVEMRDVIEAEGGWRRDLLATGLTP